MPGLHIIERTAAQWGVPLPVPSVLHAPGAERAPGQAPSGRDAGSDCQISRKSWPGRGVGVRGPIADETPLSAEEARHGLTRCLL